MSAYEVPIVRGSTESRDFDEVRDLISRRYVNHVPRLTGSGHDFEFRSRVISAGDLVIDRPRYLARMSFQTEPFPTLLTSSVLSGRYSVSDGHVSGQATAGEVILYPPGAALDLVLDRSDQYVCQIPMEAVLRTVGRLGVSPDSFRFDAVTPISAAAGRRWADTIVYLIRILAAPGETGIHSLMLTSLIETAAATAVTVFPNATMTMNYVPGPEPSTPAAVRRAVAYVDAHAADPITLEDIAAAAGVGVRALQAGFRRHLDTTPMAYLFRVRLEQAHHALQAADPSVATVATIAHRWGFTHLGRFSVRYRSAFGRRPSETLRS
ncbi:AraC family transcriptional regulator [Actinoplanes sp. LDG1-06]|uniref:AraC family transcriptional regulator n=1 Tax=Paractinoplanes ovalisporus TaxID=2810368 RepID=A0ABS2AHW0_9ACTN|nr:AraC family transcriptional regulator [Actinoplanes ovalisporus]MBM2619425.1 AraC family transcriptional regulator [Actinoplanes ovalisporus]